MSHAWNKNVFPQKDPSKDDQRLQLSREPLKTSDGTIMFPTKSFSPHCYISHALTQTCHLSATRSSHQGLTLICHTSFGAGRSFVAGPILDGWRM